ncbi:MAG TPA: hypothetical protein VLR88_00910 [Propionibacteriaceae bacterium]|nr:hypothetical protein [Propionibacteriaceae bacterium]
MPRRSGGRAWPYSALFLVASRAGRAGDLRTHVVDPTETKARLAVAVVAAKKALRTVATSIGIILMGCGGGVFGLGDKAVLGFADHSPLLVHVLVGTGSVIVGFVSLMVGGALLGWAGAHPGNDGRV